MDKKPIRLNIISSSPSTLFGPFGDINPIDSDRMPRILGKLWFAWQERPELSLNKLIMEITEVEDSFNIGDDDFEEDLDHYLKEYGLV